VLIVDDRAQNIRLMKAMLAPAKYELLTATNGEEALNNARHTRPVAILLDAMMPQMSGFDACRRLKGESSTCLFPVVLVRALKGRQNKLKSCDASADAFIADSTLWLSDSPRMLNFDVNQTPDIASRRSIGHNARGFTDRHAAGIGHLFYDGADHSEDCRVRTLGLNSSREQRFVFRELSPISRRHVGFEFIPRIFVELISFNSHEHQFALHLNVRPACPRPPCSETAEFHSA
jgi:CheY-like chemotaxis protein